MQPDVRISISSTSTTPLLLLQQQQQPSPLVMRLVAQLVSVVLVTCVTAVLFFLGGWP